MAVHQDQRSSRGRARVAEGSSPSRAIQMNRRRVVAAWIAAICAALVLTLQPVNSGALRAAWLLSLLSVFILPFFIWPRSWPVRTAIVVCFAVPSVLIALPSRSFSTGGLRASSVDVLRSFEGTRYVWGGEGRLGID